MTALLFCILSGGIFISHSKVLAEPFSFLKENELQMSLFLSASVSAVFLLLSSFYVKY